MMVWGNMKKILAGGLVAGCMMMVSTTTLTGCLTDDKTDSVKVIDKSIKLTGERMNDTIWNVQGPNKGAFNLVANVNVGSTGAAADKNLLDLTDKSVLVGTAIVYPKTLGSANGTTFILPATFNYANATDSTVIKAFKAGGTPLTTTPVLSKDKVIIANLKGAGTTYAVILITAVVETEPTATGNDNKDYMTFNYKLTP
jgi:hypothetical protein